MNTAQRILSEHKWDTYAQSLALEANLRKESSHMSYSTPSAKLEAGILSGGGLAACFGCEWHFRDGSSVRKTRNGYTSHSKLDSIPMVNQ